MNRIQQQLQSTKRNLIKSLFFLHFTLYTLPFSYAQSTLITGATIHIGNGQVIENGAIAFEKGKIIFVGSTQTVSADRYTEVINATGKHVYPGFISPNSVLGLNEVDAVRSTADYAETGSINPNARTLIAYNADSRVIPTIRSNGVLITQATPRGGLISGTTSLMCLDGWNWEDAVYKADDGVVLNWPKELVPTAFSDLGPTAWEKNKNYDKAISDITKFFKEAKAYQEVSPLEKNLRYEAMRGLFDGTKNLYINASSAKEISEAVLFAQKHSVIKTVITGAHESYLVADLLKKYNTPVIIRRPHSLPNNMDEDIDEPYKLAKQLKDAGVLYAISNEGEMEAMLTRNLPFLAGTTVTYGITKEEALQSITLNTAKILGIDKTAGSLEEGKDAILFVSTGDALDMRTNNVEQAYIRGKKVDLNNHQKQLYEKYKKKYELK